MAAGGEGERSLKETPSWAVALVCAVFVIISVVIERAIHFLEKWFQKRQKKAMAEALEKIKAELMLLGFISLLITAGTKPISKICIPEKVGEIMLPCKVDEDDKEGYDRRKLLIYAGDAITRRVLAAPAGGDDYCTQYGKVSLISQSGVHQLHIFIFVLAVVHVIYSVITIGLAQAKVKRWKSWEMETTSLEYQFTNDPSRFRLTHQTSFVKRHSTGLSATPGIRWIVAFFRQFFASVTRIDYLTLRHGFINAHFAPNSQFNFHKYIKRSMEDDFKKVVGISIPLWICSITFQLLNVYGWYTFTLIPVIPLAIVLVIDSKLEIIIMQMAQQIQDKATVLKGVPVVEPSNKYFWFNRPDMILFLIHFTLFQNAFQMAYFLWTWYEFGLKSCFHESLPGLIIRVAFAVALQLLCSYVTFPLYALVTQMGSHMKKAIFEEQTAKALKNWQKAAKERKKLKNNKARKADVSPSSLMMSPESTPSRGSSSPIHLLNKFKHSSTDPEIGLSSPNAYYPESASPEIEAAPHFIIEDNESARQNNNSRRLTESRSADFSFAMS